MDDIVSLIIIGILIALTAFFVASEFAIVRVRSSRIDQLIAEGNKKAVRAKQVVSDLDEYLSACQLGITITALGLGWMGEPTVKKVHHNIEKVQRSRQPQCHLFGFLNRDGFWGKFSNHDVQECNH